MCATHPDILEPGDPVTTLMYDAMDDMASFVYDPLWREKLEELDFRYGVQVPGKQPRHFRITNLPDVPDNALKVQLRKAPARN